ncbi:MAG: hypothetical protein N3C63_03720 [Rhodocyclaceae bacterium]|nr:hypothetical protein [Rhodocyclaceae bacterium]
MSEGERHLRLIREIEANREFLLMVYRQNPALLARAEPRIQALFGGAPQPRPATVQCEPGGAMDVASFRHADFAAHDGQRRSHGKQGEHEAENGEQ